MNKSLTKAQRETLDRLNAGAEVRSNAYGAKAYRFFHADNPEINGCVASSVTIAALRKMKLVDYEWQGRTGRSYLRYTITDAGKAALEGGK